jgi:hypothetical protein
MFVVRLENVEIEIIFLETGMPDSFQSKRLRDHKKLIRFCKDSIDMTTTSSKSKRVFSNKLTKKSLSIFSINIAGIFMFIISSIFLYLLNQ